MSPLDAGLLDRQIILQTATVSEDTNTGQDVLTWDDDLTIWARWLPGTARETWLASQIDATIEGIYQTYDISPRPTPDVSQIIGHDGRTYDVKGVTEIGRGEGLLIAVAAKAVAV
jgi:head-tail adaptor